MPTATQSEKISNKPKYGFTSTGEKIEAPKPTFMCEEAATLYRKRIAAGQTNNIPDPDGVWRILEEGENIPQHYRAHDKNHGWEHIEERWGHSTMTPPYACVWGHITAFAALVKK